jgi:hypothetical protein
MVRAGNGAGRRQADRRSDLIRKVGSWQEGLFTMEKSIRYWVKNNGCKFGN